MSTGKKVLAIDAGNTALKIGLFIDGKLISVERFSIDNSDQLKEFIQEQGKVGVVISSVLNEAQTKMLNALSENPVLTINHQSKLPIRLQYDTPHTLGIDRICNAVAIHSELKTEYGVAIDIGTCIKFDLVNNKGTYFGGSISPGIDLRLRSLHDYTGNLPLISNKSTPDLVGTSTDTSIRSGVMNGILKEIEGTMSAYSERYKDLTFFVTGGDSIYFDLQSKKHIFADENLTLKGLYELYKVNI